MDRFLGKIRSIAQHLRTPHCDSVLKRKSGKGMLIDMPIRWGSTPIMINRLLDLKEHILDLGVREVHLTE